jgi:hypothetical protein
MPDTFVVPVEGVLGLNTARMRLTGHKVSEK